MDVTLEFTNVGKQYRLGEVGTQSVSTDLNRLWHRFRGLSDPTLALGGTNDRDVAGGDYIWALRGINLKVRRGEVLGIIGQNGAGKSTLLKLLSRVTAPTTGRIRARGRIASLLEVGTGFHPELTGRENIFLNGAILGMTRPEIRRRLDEIIEFSGCAKYIDTPVKRYSSGMQVRLGFAVAAHLEGEVLVVDEVLAVGDQSFQKKCIGRMNEVASGGKTVLFVSHNMQSVERLCTRACVLDRGRLIMDGNVSDAIARYFGSWAGEQFDEHSHVGDTTVRRGNGAARFSRIGIHDSNGQEVSLVRRGESGQFRFSVVVHEQIEEPSVRVIVQSGLTRQEITSLTCSRSQSPGPGETIDFAIEFDSTPIRPGIYPLLISLQDRNGNTIDELHNATRPLSIVSDGSDREKGLFDTTSRVIERSPSVSPTVPASQNR